MYEYQQNPHYIDTFGLLEGADVRVITIQREQYGGIVHLFIGAGCSLSTITFMPSNICLYVIKTNKVYLVLFPSLLGLGQSY